MISLNKDDEETVIKLLKDNKLVILKTDTVYGIMAIANKENELRINQMKNSLENKKISVIFDSVDTLLDNIDNLDEEKIELVKSKLPGKYTFIVNLKCLNDFDRHDFGVRVTTYSYLQRIISKTGTLLATSCNQTGYAPCKTLEEIIKQFQDKDIYLVYDGEGTDTPSSIIDIRDEIKVIR